LIVTRASHHLLIEATNQQMDDDEATWLVFIYKVICQLCRAIAPLYNRVAKSLAKNPTAMVAVVNTEENPELVQHFQVTQSPTILAIAARSSYRFDGDYNEADIMSWVQLFTERSQQPDTHTPFEETDETAQARREMEEAQAALDALENENTPPSAADDAELRRAERMAALAQAEQDKMDQDLRDAQASAEAAVKRAQAMEASAAEEDEPVEGQGPDEEEEEEPVEGEPPTDEEEEEEEPVEGEPPTDEDVGEEEEEDLETTWSFRVLWVQYGDGPVIHEDDDFSPDDQHDSQGDQHDSWHDDL